MVLFGRQMTFFFGWFFSFSSSKFSFLVEKLIRKLRSGDCLSGKLDGSDSFMGKVVCNRWTDLTVFANTRHKLCTLCTL